MSFSYSGDLPYEYRMLWAAVLRRAVFDYVLYKGSGTHSMDWKRAFQYIFTRGLRFEDGVSFEEVCEMFNWDPEYVRRLTTRLTRADIKKMETNQFRGEFVFDLVETLVAETERWKTSNFAAPFLPLYKYSKEYRDQMRPRVIRREEHTRLPPPMIQWQAMA
jgi:hypothetical protein